MKLNSVPAVIAGHDMIKNGDTVIVGLSGGADSMALFHFLFTHKDFYGITLAAAHINHGLRGKAADADEAFVAGICAQYGVPLYRTTLCPPADANEAWARTERYAFFARLAAEHSAKIATAHTLNDNVETLLFRMARGTGSRGLCGIPYVRECYIRPLLDTPRAEVEAYCAENQLRYVTDETNNTDAYARNIVRHHVLPALRQINPAALQAMHRLSSEMACQQAYIDAQADALLQTAETDCGYKADVLCAAHSVIRTAALTLLIARYTSPHRRYTALLNNAVLRGSGGVEICEDTVLCVENGLVRVKAAPAVKAVPAWELPLAEGIFTLPCGGTLCVKVENYKKTLNSYEKPKKSLIFIADYDRILVNPSFRTRRTGDVFCPMFRKVTKTLKKLFIEDGIPAAERGNIPVLACGSEILWAAGYGFAHSLRVTEVTEKIITIQYNK